MPVNTAFPQYSMKVLTEGKDGGLFVTAWRQFLQNIWDRMGGGFGGGAVGPGGIVFNAATDVPNGWFLADGQAVNRAQNPDLFKAIGTTYGAGDGSTTFNVPTLPDYNGMKALIRS